MKSGTDKNLEQALVRAALARYREWVEKYGEPNAWGEFPNVRTKKGWNMLMATKAIHDAKRRSR